MSESETPVFLMSQLEPWIDHFGPRLFLYARQQTQSHADAQDVYQESIIQVIQRCKQQGDREIPPIGVFFKSIKHRSIDLHRSQRSRLKREMETHQLQLYPHEDSPYFDLPLYRSRDTSLLKYLPAKSSLQARR